MRIPALALAQRALLVDARGHAPYVLRGLLAAFMLVAIWLLVQGSSRFGAPGQYLCRCLLYANFFFISLFGISTFSAAVTEEKEDMTLGLLKMAGFSGSSILLGKSIAHLLAMLLLLLVQVPFALLAITLGGVSAYQVATGWLLLLAHLLFVYALGLCASVIAGRSSQAARLCAMALLAYYLLPGIAMWLASGVSRQGSVLFKVGWAVWESSALQALIATTRTGFARPWVDMQVLVTLAMAAVLFALAGLLFGPCTRSEVAAAPARPSREYSRRRSTIPRLKGDPVFWKDFHFLGGGRTGMVRRFAVGLIALFAIRVMTASSPQSFGEVTMSIMFLALACELGIQAERMFQEEIKWRTLPMLVLVPIPLRNWVYAKALAPALFALPYLVYLAVGLAYSERFLLKLTHGVGWYILGIVIAGLHLTAWLSLHLRRGAFAVAILVMLIVHMLLWILGVDFGRRGRFVDAFRIVAAALLVSGALALHPVIARQLTRKAAE